MAMAHMYAHHGGNTAYTGAPKDKHLNQFAEKLAGYNVGHFGDNHIHWTGRTLTSLVWNGGSMYNARSDEYLKQPKFGVLYQHTTGEGEYFIEPVPYDNEGDKWAVTPNETAAQELSLIHISEPTRPY